MADENKTFFEKHPIKILLLFLSILSLILIFTIYKYFNKYFKYNKLSFGENYNPVEALMDA